MVGRGVFLQYLPVLRKNQPHRPPVGIVHAYIQFRGQLACKISKALHPAVLRPDKKPAQMAAVHKHAAAPIVHRLGKVQLFQGRAVVKRVISHPPQRGRQGHGFDAPWFVPRRSPSADNAQRFPLRRGAVGRKSMVAQCRHRKAPDPLRQENVLFPGGHGRHLRPIGRGLPPERQRALSHLCLHALAPFISHISHSGPAGGAKRRRDICSSSRHPPATRTLYHSFRRFYSVFPSDSPVRQKLLNHSEISPLTFFFNCIYCT